MKKPPKNKFQYQLFSFDQMAVTFQKQTKPNPPSMKVIIIKAAPEIYRVEAWNGKNRVVSNVQLPADNPQLAKWKRQFWIETLGEDYVGEIRTEVSPSGELVLIFAIATPHWEVVATSPTLAEAQTARKDYLQDKKNLRESEK